MKTNVIQPIRVVRLRFLQKALDMFKEWIEAGLSGDLGEIARLDKIRGNIFAWFWFYTMLYQSSWTAEAGYYYYRNRKLLIQKES